MKRHYAFFGENGTSLAMQEEIIKEGVSKLTFAVAFCNPHIDHFQKHIARKILNGRLDTKARLSIGSSGPESDASVRMTFATLYQGDRSKRDVMYPLMDVLRDERLAGGREYQTICWIKEYLERMIAKIKDDREVTRLRIQTAQKTLEVKK